MHVFRSPVVLVGVAAPLASSPARSQDFTGTYQVAGNGTTVTLTLRQARSGQITGTLHGSTDLHNSSGYPIITADGKEYSMCN